MNPIIAAMNINAERSTHATPEVATQTPVFAKELTELGLRFVHNEELLPITRDVINDRTYTGGLLRVVLELGLLEGQHPSIAGGVYKDLARTYAKLHDATEDHPSFRTWRYSVSELHNIPDETLLSIKSFGIDSLALLRRGTRRVMESLPAVTP